MTSTASSAKIRALLRANDTLQRQLNQARREHDDSYRVKLIKRLRVELRDAQAVTEAFKTRANLSDDEIVHVYDEVLNTALRPRKPLPEELQQTIAKLKKDNLRLTRKLKAKTKSSSTPTPTTPNENDVDHAQLRVSAVDASTKSSIAQYKDLTRQAEARVRDLKPYKDKWERACARERDKEQVIAQLREELIEASTERERIMLQTSASAAPESKDEPSTAKERALAHEVSQLREKVDAMRSTLAEHRQQLEATTTVDAEAEVVALRAQLEVVQEELTRAGAAPTPHQEEDEDEEALNSAEHKAMVATVAADAHKAKFDQATTQLETTTAQLTQAKAALEETNTQLQHATEQNTQWEAKCTALAERVERAELAVSAATQGDGNAALAALQDENRRLRHDNELVARETLHNAGLVQTVKTYAHALLTHVDGLEKAMRGHVPPLPVPPRPTPPP